MEARVLIGGTLRIYCDGACSGNPGPGGWGAVLIWKKHIKTISGAEEGTTNNRMELVAAIEALKIVKKKVLIEVYTDSMYLQKGITEWVGRWSRNNWKSGKRQIRNVDLWKQLDALSGILKISWHWLKGHSGHQYNEMADRLAREAIATLRVSA